MYDTMKKFRNPHIEMWDNDIMIKLLRVFYLFLKVLFIRHVGSRVIYVT